ncbi:protein-L-isoaspartate O-methyltransferase [Actinomadura sp. NBRC 104412]|uniref:methyltransferase domain-containing protein n=1 Tax=Actinomadura sp. NBRC 104412 TaxID=3032203 RepID=UPI0024A23AD1|nr:methyltransferase domain-containing protein [Actinomadura sp. NBRC 104412]GLZ04377.1 protein-L-isoaspartate O-methyltransferase [Actinomadura sp. NBRC 104412]
MSQELVERLVAELTAAGRLTDPRWAEALRAVPRHLFVPDVAWAVFDRPGADGAAIDRNADPDRWLDVVYSDTAIATQVDDGAGDPGTCSGTWTSSCSTPGIVAIFLELLRPLDHHRVLEIGTGTGWTSALLSWRLGGGNVTSVEIDEAIAERAAANVAAAGQAPRLVRGDGERGHADGAPYDRVHVTCGVERVPYPWVEQCRPGGVIVMPWLPGWNMGHIARLTAAGDGTASGRLTGQAGFMMLRSQRRPPGPPADADTGAAEESATRLDPRILIGDAQGADVAITALVPGVRTALSPAADGSMRVWAIETAGGSWAAVDFTPGRDDFRVLQYGPRPLGRDRDRLHDLGQVGAAGTGTLRSHRHAR